MKDIEKPVEEIEVVDPKIESGCNAVRLCDPEDLFDIIEQCKICGRCI